VVQIPYRACIQRVERLVEAGKAESARSISKIASEIYGTGIIRLVF
jgi:uncharacterized protein (UPF0335 family)